MRRGSSGGKAGRLRGDQRHRRFEPARGDRRGRGGVLRRDRRSGARGGAGRAARPGEWRAVLRLQFLRAPNQGSYGYGGGSVGRTVCRRRGDGAGPSAPASNPALDQRSACRSRSAGALGARHVGKHPRGTGRRVLVGQDDPLDHDEGARGAGLRMRARRAEGRCDRDRARLARRHLPRLRLEEALGLHAGAGHDPRRPARRGNARGRADRRSAWSQGRDVPRLCRLAADDRRARFALERSGPVDYRVLADAILADLDAKTV